MSIDLWTIGLQAVNFLILMWILQRFLYQPLRAVLARRQAAVARLQADAETERAQAEALRQGLEQERGRIEQERGARLLSAQQEAETQKRELLAKAGTEAARLLDETRAALARDRDDAQQALAAQAADLASAMAARLLDGVAPSVPDRDFIERALERLRTLDVEARRRLIARMPSDGGPEVVTARALPGAQSAAIAERLGEIIGVPVNPIFRTEPALLAGVEVRFPEWVLRQSWAGDLERLRAQLTATEAHAETA